ncbi:MAG: 50S ribosomal protein L1 [Bacteroidia bacterium]|nr:50S ribosomal protein L1 [Bacteroidia bacterium]MDW8158653.1 50S ribosomal protein L1 [Bacteroidia bacterium]
MAKRSKKYLNALKQYDNTRSYSLEEAANILKKISYVKFDSSVDIAVRLGVDPRQANQMVRGVASLPHGTGKEVKVLVLTGPENEQAAKNAGAEYVGLDDYLAKIQGGWTDVDVIICTPDVMPKVGRLGKILGPRGLMPNPKSGTVTTDVYNAVKEVKAGKIDFRVDKTGIIHATVGKISFSPIQIAENAMELVQALAKLKPTGIKDTYFKTIHLSSTMSPSVKIDKSTIPGI